ncbi:hypothetical protein Moror_5813 [Moniliophthora roreri MCA 2997]|uniref:Uncharacterized protein n=1 Tax=Moniliophthora roreri (strain MCA 2997) TaxID=1381753 RepID=V2X458_MONRO|nr:hypothetical protein Moror_5813 [Moniliophthora roreri MCA 2997]
MVVETLVDIFANVQASRYLSVAGVVILLYDHLLTTLFLTPRYVVTTCVSIHTYESSGLTHSVSFPDLMLMFGIDSVLQSMLCLGMITIALGNLVVLLHVWSIWERKSRFVKGIMALYIATHLASIVSLATAVLMIIPVTTFSHELRLCIMSDRDVSFTMLWVPELVFEVSMLDAVIWNALDRPRSEKVVGWMLNWISITVGEPDIVGDGGTLVDISRSRAIQVMPL